MRRPRALVIDGSLGGLLAANVLREVCAWDVDVLCRCIGITSVRADALHAALAGAAQHVVSPRNGPALVQYTICQEAICSFTVDA